MTVNQKNVTIGFGYQSAFDTGVVPSQFLRVTEASIPEEVVTEEIEETGDRDATSDEVTGFDYSVNVQGKFDASEPCHRIVHSMFQTIDSETGAGPYTHVLRPKNDIAATDLLSVSLDNQIAALDGSFVARRVKDCIASQLVLTIEPRVMVSYSWALKGCDLEGVAAISPSYPAKQRYGWPHLTVEQADAGGGLATLSKVSRVVLTFDSEPDLSAFVAGNNQPDMGIFGNFRARCQIVRQAVTGGDPFYTAVHASPDTKKDIRVKLTYSAGWSIQFDFNACTVVSFEPPMASGSPSRGMNTIEATPYNDGTNPSVLVTTVDDVSGGY